MSMRGMRLGLFCLLAACGEDEEQAEQDGAAADGGADGSTDAAQTDAAEGLGTALYSIQACEGAMETPGATRDFPPCDKVCEKAHCLPIELATNVPESASCPDDGSGAQGRCVPDALADLSVPEGAPFEFGDCTFFIDGSGGACVPVCYVPVESHALLRRGECGEEELCVPCVDQNGAPNGLCDICDAALDGGVDAGVEDAGADAGDLDATTDGGADAGADEDAGDPGPDADAGDASPTG